MWTKPKMSSQEIHGVSDEEKRKSRGNRRRLKMKQSPMFWIHTDTLFYKFIHLVSNIQQALAKNQALFLDTVLTPSSCPREGTFWIHLLDARREKGLGIPQLPYLVSGKIQQCRIPNPGVLQIMVDFIKEMTKKKMQARCEEVATKRNPFRACYLSTTELAPQSPWEANCFWGPHEQFQFYLHWPHIPNTRTPTIG